MSTATVIVERMAPEGPAIARAPGSSRVIFVPHGVPGDRLEIELTLEKSSFARGRILKLLEPGVERREPPCALHYDPSRARPACGGCDWQQFKEEAQLRHKREIISDCLVRIAKLRDVAVEPVIPSPSVWGYRNKVQVPFTEPAPGGTRPRAGFYATGSRDIVDMEDCPVQPELSVRVVRAIKDTYAKQNWGRQRGWLKHLYLRTNSRGEALAALVTRAKGFPGGSSGQESFIAEMNKSFPEIVSLYQNIQPLETAVILGPDWIRLWGRRQLQETIGRFKFQASPGAFLQVNTPAAALLYDAALAALRHGGRTWETVLDLYCGVGTLSAWVASSVGRVVGVEENRDAVRDAYKNIELNGIKNARFSAGRAEALLPKLMKSLPGRELAALVDPPRAGLSVPVMRCLTAAPLRRLVYLSCDPATFARDAGYLTQAGYKLLRVAPFDLFPQTSHVELVGLFDR